MVAPKNRRPGMMSESRIQDLQRHVKILTAERDAAREEVKLLNSINDISKTGSDFLTRELNEARFAIGVLVAKQGGKVKLTEQELVAYDGYVTVFKDLNTYDITIEVRPKKESDETGTTR